jgi:hypothetical protein
MRTNKPAVIKKSIAAFTNYEYNIQKDIVILSIVRAVLLIAKTEGNQSSLYVDPKKVYYDRNDELINHLEANTRKFIDEYDNMESRIKKRDFLSIINFKKKANDIYIVTLIDKRFNNDFNLEIFAINLLISRFIDRVGLFDMKRKSTSTIMKFVDVNFLNIVSKAMISYFNTDDFTKEYNAASIVCEKIQKLSH